MENQNQGGQIQQQEVEKKVRGKADIVFIIDVTGSMGPALEGLKENLNKFVDELEGTVTKDQQKVDWRARVIGFRDVVADGANWWVESEFVSDADALKNQINALKPSGGGDAPENALDALLLAAKKTDWGEKRHHFILFFTDAPTKEKIDPSNLEPGEPDNVEYVRQILYNKRIKLFMVCPEDNKGIYKELERTPKTKSIYVGKEGEERIYEGLKNQNWNELLESIAKTISDTSGTPIPA